MSRYFPYCQGSSYFQIRVRHFESSGEFPHQEDGDGEHDEGEEDMNPEVDSIRRLGWTEVGQGGVTELCSRAQLWPLEIQRQHQPW